MIWLFEFHLRVLGLQVGKKSWGKGGVKVEELENKMKNEEVGKQKKRKNCGKRRLRKKRRTRRRRRREEDIKII